MTWLRTNLARVVTLLLVALLIAAALTARSCQRERTATTETSLARGQADAATASGKDAVETVGTRAQVDAATDTITRENADAIRSAEGASAPVAAPVRDAGLASLCRRASYRRDPKCVQHARP
ncbi:hypothetical protein [Sphingomonas sp.]|jgi:hypothetical protein|uniref:hypothetical protein n=1 Tax=Sphingomonas sp. TaxID=28214 RepID=UPI002D7F08DC|nr:hypothetical protein [Sphingomonas sp.]HEU0045063.1 hypothetical protein [Sphingomonas sp.]